MFPSTFNLTDLPPEEQDYVTQLGKISRPFAHDPRSPLLLRTLELYYQIRAAAVYDIDPLVDVSYWNGVIDFELLAPHVKGIIARYGYGNTYVDPTAEANARGAEDYSLPWGGYWYLTADKSWETHAISFAAVWKELGGQLYPDFDLEENRGLGKSALANWVYKCINKFCDLRGVSPTKTMVYTSAGFYNANVEPGIIKSLKTKLHVAHWTTLPSPTLPVDWQSYTFWQYSSKGVIPGNGSSYIDLNRYYGTKAQFETEFGVIYPEPPPPPVPATVTVNVATLNLRAAPADGAVYIPGTTTLGKVWKTTGMQSKDAAGRGWWYQVSDEHGQPVWLAGWLCK